MFEERLCQSQKGPGVRVEPLPDEGVQRAVLFHGVDGAVQLVLQLAIVLPDADAGTGVEHHLGADDG